MFTLSNEPGYYEIRPDENGRPTVYGSHSGGPSVWIVLLVIAIVAGIGYLYLHPEAWEKAGDILARLSYLLFGYPDLPNWML